VQELEDEDDFGGVKACGVFVEALGFAEVGEYFAARAVIKLNSVSSSEIFWLGWLTSIYRES
jgi:hypothetical protein